MYSFLKKPGAFGYTRACANIKPDMLMAVIIKSQLLSFHSLVVVVRDSAAGC